MTSKLNASPTLGVTTSYRGEWGGEEGGVGKGEMLRWEGEGVKEGGREGGNARVKVRFLLCRYLPSLVVGISNLYVKSHICLCLNVNL